MKRIGHIFWILAAVSSAAFQACSVREEIPDLQEQGQGIVLNFSTGGSFVTKAQKDGEDPLNENTLQSVEYFLYRDGYTDEDAVLHGYLSPVAEGNSYQVPMTSEILNNLLCPNNAEYFCVYAIANHSRIVAEAATEDLSHTSVPELEALTCSLYTNNEGKIKPTQDMFTMASDGPLRVKLIGRNKTTVASATVDLKRIASKLSLLVHVPESITFPNTVVISGETTVRYETWTPDIDNMEVYLVNGNMVTTLDGKAADTPNLFKYPNQGFDQTKSESRKYYSYDLRTNDEGKPVDSEGNVIDMENEAYKVIYDETEHTGDFIPCVTPFYSMPQKWDYGSNEEPYIKIILPWYYGTNGKQYYYRVYCPSTKGDGVDYDAEFLRNMWYKVFVNIGILGSEADEGDIILDGTYYVAEWQERDKSDGGGEDPSGVNDSDKEAEIKGARYLYVNKTNFELFNVNVLTIPYLTSDPCEIVSASASKYDFSGTTRTTVSTNNPVEWGIGIALTAKGGAHITFSHNLNNDTSTTDYDVSGYTITFTLQQITNPDYKAVITIKQYPAIMIDMERNDVSTSPYSAYVNNGTVGNSGGTYYLGSSPGSGDSSNNNYNMIIIETTVLPSDSDYMLGDPRTTYIDNLNANWPNNTNGGNPDTNWSVSRPSVQGTTRTLSYYYPANRDNASNNIIAPKLRIASSRGATQPMTYANAFRRCASYQEYGYPAGRWRLPTVAEIQYIAKLNSDGKIERLLGGETITYTVGRNSYSRAENWQASKTDADCYTEYWCNSGYMKVYNGKTTNWTNANGGRVPAPEIGDGALDGTKYVRCVYDNWYWDGMKLNGNDVSTVNKTTFTWGDMAR